MASAFSHAIVAVTLGTAWKADRLPLRFWFLGAACSAAPDLDALGYWIGIPYEHMLGHRGITHSFVFAALLSCIVVAVAFKESDRPVSRVSLLTYFFLVTALHGVLDAMTDGGLGVAFFSPFDNTRYFFPFRPLVVPPLEPESFFTTRGIRVLMSELKWVWFPCTFVFAVLCARRCLQAGRNPVR